MLMNLFLDVLAREITDLHRNGVRMRFMGNRELLGASLTQRMDHAESLTAANRGLVLIVALAYGGRWDIAQACRSLAQDVAAGLLPAAAVDEAAIASRLAFAGVPDPDLLIRTGSERRISNFMLWNLAYTELYFCDVLWPEFGAQQLAAAFDFFSGRERRFGKTSAQLAVEADA
jgi:undecaprenyl diphosphate synthase